MKTIKLAGFIAHSSISKYSKQLNIKWSIKNFGSLIIRNEPMKIFIADDSYPQDFNEELKFSILIKFMGCDVKNKDKLLIMILYAVPEPVALHGAYVYSMDKGYRSDKICGSSYKNEIPAKTWSYFSDMASKFQTASSIHNFLCDGHLDLEFEFNIRNDNKTDTEFENVVTTTLINDLQNLLTNTTLNDITIKSIDGVELTAHKVVLFARSEVFKASFDHGTKESFTNLVESPFEADVMKEVLQYMYTDTAPKLNKMPEKMLEAADFYQIQGLKNQCEQILYKKLSVYNAIETLSLADQHSANKLKELTIKFINNGHIDEVLKTEGWKNLKSATLIKSIYEYNLKQ